MKKIVIKNQVELDALPNNFTEFTITYPPNEKGEVTLYKSVNPETGNDFQTGTIKYEGIVKCPDWNGDPKLQCGNGLHLSPSPNLALSYHKGKLLECKVHKNDFVVFTGDITKVRCKKVKVVGEYKKGNK